MSMHFIRAGLQTSIQDYGRPGLMHYGIPIGGAADPLSMKLANMLLGNPLNNPVLEITLTGPLIEFTCDVSIAITGAQFKTSLNNRAIEYYKVIQVKRGDILNFSKLISGMRAYIGISAKISTPMILGSTATHLISGFGGHHDRAIENGDRIGFVDTWTARPAKLKRELQPNYKLRPLIRVVHGPEAGSFSQEIMEKFSGTSFQVSAQSNRMGIRLSPSINPSREALTETSGKMISSGLYPGSIQIPENGEPIISFIEGQTIGGYPRLAHVIRADLHRLGQLNALDKISFQVITLENARIILREKQKSLEKLQREIATETRGLLTL
ncbi:biotin-dependent carboxyltransferase family protein [Microbulbifer sp. ANSA001]|uniref:5-oxoprolinase subunit C family protein n=1 Tax=Microbulbifer sp. ANSA001 TaxID=3243358 RepID=UPI004042D48E